MTKKLSKIWGIDYPKDWEEVGGKMFGVSAEEAKKNGKIREAIEKLERIKGFIEKEKLRS